MAPRESGEALDASAEAMSEILHGDAADMLGRYRGEATLLYADPCFNTGDTFTTKDGSYAQAGEVAFVDRFPSPDDFELYLRRLMAASRAALADHGALVVHCDYRFQPLVRVIGDRLFSEDPHEGLADQIVWNYRRWSVAHRRCNRVHDYLIRYVKDERIARWTQLYQPLAESTRATWGTKKQKAVIVAGERQRSATGEEESPGVPIGDVWSDIGIIAPSSKERTGYPTQKPEKLLERVLTITTLPGDLVIDPTMGSGTTLVVAERMGRRSTGIDRSYVAVKVAGARLLGRPPR